MRIDHLSKIWDRAPHNAFTDLIRFRERWFLSFREGESHLSGDGTGRALTSEDGKSWTTAATFSSPFQHLVNVGDCHLCTLPDGRLMMHAPGWNSCWPEQQEEMCVTLAWFSSDGECWSDPVAIGDLNWKLWRVRWYGQTGYGVACPAREDLRGRVRLYSTLNGTGWSLLCDPLYEDDGHPNEAQLLFLGDGRALCLLRRNFLPEQRDDGAWLASAKLGTADAPYEQWRWLDLGVAIGGPDLIQLPHGRVLAAVRLWHGDGWDQQHLALCDVDADAGGLTEILALPSGGDSTYAGMVYHEDQLWVSYYSSHEGKASIYLAQILIRDEGS